MMHTIQGLVKNGQIALEEPIDWPEGTKVRVHPVEMHDDEKASCDLEGALAESTDSEAIARWIAEFDAIPPLEMTAAEEAEWQAARKAQRDLEQARTARLDFAPGTSHR